MVEYSKRAIKKIRAALDSFSHDPALITLTYREPESIRCINEMRQRVTDFIQRAGCNRDIRWIATCDVMRDGTEVHHHVVTQGLILVDRDFIARCWEYGQVYFADMADYVDLAQYLSKCVYVFGHYPERGHNMDEIENVDELIERLGRNAKEYAIAGDWASAEFLTACSDAIKGQRARAEEAEARCEFRDLVIKAYQDEFTPKYCALIERLKQERDTAVSQLASLEPCGFCKNALCVERDGTQECNFIWCGVQEDDSNAS